MTTRHAAPRFLQRVLCLVALAAVASGCRAALLTEFDVSAAPAVSAQVVIEFDQVAAAAFDDQLVSRLQDTVFVRTGYRPTIQRRDASLTLQVPVSYSQLAALAPLTGVADVRLELVDAALAILYLELVEPTELKAAVIEAVSSQPDAAALQAATLRYSQVGVRVRFPGEILQVVTPGVDVAPEVKGDTVQVTQSLDRYAPGQLAVAGTLTTQTGYVWWPPAAAGAALLAFAAALWWVRRRP